MRTAQEAWAATRVQIDNIAREFTVNEISNAIEKKINEGKFSLRMPLSGVRGQMKDYSSAILAVLKEKGYKAELCDKSNDKHDDEVYIKISWEE